MTRVLLPLAVGVVAGVVIVAGLVLYAADSILRAWGWLRG